MTVLENLKPGQFAKVAGNKRMFLISVKSADRKLFLFDSGLVLDDAESEFVTEVLEEQATNFVLSKKIVEAFINLKAVIIDPLMIVPGQVILLVSSKGNCFVREIAVVDHSRNMVYDKNGEIVDLDFYKIIDTGCTVEIRDLLTNEGNRILKETYLDVK